MDILDVCGFCTIECFWDFAEYYDTEVPEVLEGELNSQEYGKAKLARTKMMHGSPPALHHEDAIFASATRRRAKEFPNFPTNLGGGKGWGGAEGRQLRSFPDGRGRWARLQLLLGRRRRLQAGGAAGGPGRGRGGPPADSPHTPFPPFALPLKETKLSILLASASSNERPSPLRSASSTISCNSSSDQRSPCSFATRFK